MAHGIGRSPSLSGRGADGAALLSVRVGEPRGGVLVLAPDGEMDGSSAPVLRRAVHEAVGSAPRAVVVDLSGLTFCGSTGLVTLLDAKAHAGSRGVGFGTAGGRPVVLRVLEITGFGPAIGHRDTLDEALTAAVETRR